MKVRKVGEDDRGATVELTDVTGRGLNIFTVIPWDMLDQWQRRDIEAGRRFEFDFEIDKERNRP